MNRSPRLRFASRISILSLMFGMLCAALAHTSSADELYGKVRGVVSDSSGAVVPDVQLVLTNAGTNVSSTLESSSSGLFEFINLKPGVYKLVATKSNFKTFAVSSINIEANQIYVQNVIMELGALNETVQVEADLVQVEQTSMQLATTISAKSIVDLPLIGRNWITLQQIMPGVVTPDTRFGTSYSTNGSQAQQNSYLVNGNDSNDLPLNTPLAVPNPDTIQEVRMVTNTINPEFGRNSGAVMNAITKSGTNSIHGTGFWFYRDTFLNTHNFFSSKDSNGVPIVPVFHQNLFGGTVGGPIIKNKIFFFYGLQITRARAPQLAQTNTVFTQDQLNGQFDPTLLSTNPIPFAAGLQGPNGNCPQGTTFAACFTGGVIPTSNFNPLSVQLTQQFVPLPTDGNQATFSPTSVTKTNQHVGRLDWSINQKDSLWFYALANDSSSINQLPFTGATVAGFGDQSVPFTKQFTASWNHVFSSNVLNEFRLGYTRLNFVTGQPVNNRQPADVGFPNIIPQLPSGADYPQISITGYFTLGGTNNGPQPRKDQTYQITDNFSWNKGRHSFKFGYDGRKFQVWNPFANSNDGVFTFDTRGTFSSGDPGLDFLLGIPTQYAQGSGSIIIADAYENYLYGQDQWRIKDNLTITYGAGYQIDTPIAEYQNGGISRACFQPTVQSTVFPTAPLGYTVPGDPGCNKQGGAHTHYNHIGPRAGFAYSPNWGGKGKFSIRGGFGLYFNRGEEELNLQDLGTAPFGLNSAGVTDASSVGNNFTPSFPNPFQDISTGFTLANPFPYVPPGAGATNIDFSIFEPFGFNMSVIPKNFTNPYSMNYNLTVERELPAQMILRVGYVGAHASNLITSYTFNPMTKAGVQTCLADPSCSGDIANDVFNFPNLFTFPGDIWGSGGQETNGGYSNYNSLQVTLDKHFSHGLQFLSAYTYSHSLDISSSFEDTAFQAGGGVSPYGEFGRDYGSSAFDARHRWAFSMDYEIPSLKRLWGAAPGRIFDGWRVTGFNAIQSGFPIILQDSNNLSLSCNLDFSFYGCPDRPDLVSVPHILNPKTSVIGTKNHYWFDPASYTDNAIGTLGTAGRGSVYGPHYWNTDASLQKDTRITEGKTLQMRIEFYNIFNHTNFANPSGNVASGNFGRITAIRANTASRQIQLGAKFIF
jgi:hypothetical protein